MSAYDLLNLSTQFCRDYHRELLAVISSKVYEICGCLLEIQMILPNLVVTSSVVGRVEGGGGRETPRQARTAGHHSNPQQSKCVELCDHFGPKNVTRQTA